MLQSPDIYFNRRHRNMSADILLYLKLLVLCSSSYKSTFYMMLYARVGAAHRLLFYFELCDVGVYEWYYLNYAGTL